MTSVREGSLEHLGEEEAPETEGHTLPFDSVCCLMLGLAQDQARRIDESIEWNGLCASVHVEKLITVKELRSTIR